MDTTESSTGFWGKLLESFQNIRKTVAASQVVNSKLDDLGLSHDSIASQDSAQLLMKLEEIDSYLEAGVIPQQFGNVTFSLFKTILLTRRRLVINRLSLLAQEKKIDELKGFAQKLPEKGYRADLEKLSQEMKGELQQYYAAQQKQIEDQSAKDSKDDRGLSFFLRRDLVANLVGAFLIFGLIGILVIASFKKVVMPETIGNALSMVLGYFFARHAKE